jgi:hypothetical protein
VTDTNTPTSAAPPVGEHPDLDQLLHDTFVTALEGGIGYWSMCAKYHWSVDTATPDLVGFHADIVDYEDDDAEYRIDRDTIYRGLALIAAGTVAVSPRLARMIAIAFGDPETPQVDIDANVADVIVQAGLFREVAYG